ncbi:MAG: gfo/Idh/MocA family oxidoreductase, partial [Planctomycetes bacterium]|nr:gfo/Idh/MocA family oxidoreductase [Planctomycetota bacterium]
LTRAMYEARKLGEIAKEMKVATQMGNQGTSRSGLRETAALLKAGALGKVTEVYVWTNRPVWPQGIDRPQGTKPIPNGLHWEEWLGPAKARPYYSGYHPFDWRGWWDFGTGALGDMACHTVNMAYMGLDLKNPTSVEAEISGHNGETYPSWSIIKFAFPANDWRPAINLTWSDGGKRPGNEVTEGREVGRSGCVIVGEKGKFYSGKDYGNDRQIWSKDPLELPKVEFEQSPGHFVEWVRAIKGGPQAVSNFTDYAGPLTETILLGNLAVWSGKKVEWDAKNLKPTNAPELMEIVRPEYRSGYSI